MAVPRLSALLVARRLLGGQRGLAPATARCGGCGGCVCGCRGLATSARRDADRFFTKKHEWVLVDGASGTVGISKYAADALGEVVYAQLPEPGDTVASGEECGALESVKAASEVFSPVSGAVTEKNTVVEDGPALINHSPEEDGWLFKLQLGSAEEVGALMDETAYGKYLKECEDH